MHENWTIGDIVDEITKMALARIHMAKFVKLTRTNGVEVWVNLNTVGDMVRAQHEPPYTVLTLCVPDMVRTMEVRESPDEILIKRPLPRP